MSRLHFNAAAVCSLFDLSRDEFNARVRNGEFPQPRLRGKVRVWTLADVQKMKQRLAGDTRVASIPASEEVRS